MYGEGGLFSRPLKYFASRRSPSSPLPRIRSGASSATYDSTPHSRLVGRPHIKYGAGLICRIFLPHVRHVYFNTLLDSVGSITPIARLRERPRRGTMW